MYCPASPPIEYSISKLGDNVYQMGSKFICEKTVGEIPGDAIASWKDCDDTTYYLRKATSKELSSAEKQEFKDVIYQAGTSSSVWSIGTSVICKVKTCCDEMELESITLAFVAGNLPHMPIPKVVFSWRDTEWNRTFLLLKRIKGQTLHSAWPSLSLEHRDKIAATISRYCRDMATLQAPALQSATGLGVLEPFLNVNAENSHPSWKPRLLGPFHRGVFEKYIQRISEQPAPLLGDVFHFYHADLGPTNIIVSGDGEVTGVLDWESAGFYPKYWISLKPYMSAGFSLGSKESRREWVDLFETKLSEVGFELNREDVRWCEQLHMDFFDVNKALLED